MAGDSGDYRLRTMDTYDALAGKVSRGFEEHFVTHARFEADRFLDGLRKGDRILDLGSGAGPASSYFAEWGSWPVSGDLSEAMLRECQRRGLDNLVQLDLLALPFAPATFDGVWAHTSLIHVPKDRMAAAVEGIDRVLKPGGRLFVALREGAGDGYEGKPGAERWFANFKADEFERHIPSSYDVVHRGRTQRPGIAFLNFHFVKAGV